MQRNGSALPPWRKPSTDCRENQRAYGLVNHKSQKLIGVRDPFGLKPLCLGRNKKHMDDCVRELRNPGCRWRICPGHRPREIVTITRDGLHSDMSLMQEFHAHCVFEYIYFARLDSRIDNVSVYESRLRGGAALARSYPVQADLVAGVPDSGLTAAMGYAKASGIPFEMIFHKNSYVGRTFIKPNQKEREDSVKIKLSILEPAVRGKKYCPGR